MKNKNISRHTQKNAGLGAEKVPFPLSKRNFLLMAVAALLIIVGFLLMLGSGSTEEAFNPDIFSTRRIVVGPTIAFVGFLFMGYAIIYKPSKTDKKQSPKDDIEHA